MMRRAVALLALPCCTNVCLFEHLRTGAIPHEVASALFLAPAVLVAADTLARFAHELRRPGRQRSRLPLARPAATP